MDDARWAALAERRIFFGHQSVGADIMAGVTAILDGRPETTLRIVEHATLAPMSTPGIHHARVGINRDPASKADAFAAHVDAAHPDIALFKYCYVDVVRSTDADALFRDYRRRMCELRSRHPHLVIAHVTIPLTIHENWKAVLHARLRRRSTWRDDGVVRNRYNRLLRDAYAEREPVFDLARFESTRPDGSRVFFERAGQRVYALEPTYSEDGAHLNRTARFRIAEKFLAFLGELAQAHS